MYVDFGIIGCLSDLRVVEAKMKERWKHLGYPELFVRALDVTHTRNVLKLDNISTGLDAVQCMRLHNEVRRNEKWITSAAGAASEAKSLHTLPMATLEPSLEQLKKRLKRYDIRGGGSPPEDLYTGLRKSCVLVPLFLRVGQWHVLLTVRSSRMRSDPSTTAFPGGARDENDVDSVRTALREAEEEVGLSENQVEIVARLFPCVAPPNHCVSVFVGIIPSDFVPRLQYSEVDQVFDIPLRTFLQNNYTTGEVELYGIKFNVPYFSVPNKPLTVWGLTAYVCIMVAFVAYNNCRNFRFLHDGTHAQYEAKDIFADYKLFFFFCIHRMVLNAKTIPRSNL